ncbi:hypothetical protein GGI07_000661 [Coemansia sp. Benny D115]|nr:hypothetical protein GGI07_000661 [Coemansia sp. Benny D115]
MTANASARPTSSSASSAHGRTLFSVSPAASPKSNTFSFSPPNIRETRTLRQTLSHMFLRPDPKLSRTPSTQAHSATVHSPLISEFSPASSTQTTSSSATKEASSGSFPPSVSTDSPQSPPGERTPLGLSPLARSFLGIVGLSNRLRSTPASSPTKSPVADTQRRERVAQMVDEYMALNDRQTNGYVTVANERRVLGLGPKRVEQKHLYYEVFGTGPRRLFLVMGMLGCTMYWRLQSRYFASLGDYTICVFDNCGSGRSTVAPGPYKVTQLARDAMAVLDHLGWKDSVHAVGVSLGGMIVQEMCLMDRVQFETVVLVDTWHSAGLAVPTAKEVTFAFKGMSALGTSPKHLIDLVFSRDWVRAPFRDMIGLEPKPHEPAIKDEPSEPPELTNGEVMLALFQAIQDDLGIQPLTVDPTPESSPGIPPVLLVYTELYPD